MYHVQFPKLGWHFHINPVAFKIGTFAVYWYGIILAAAFSLAYIYVIRNAKRFEINIDKITDCIIVGLITGIIGARLFYVFFFPGDTYLKNPMRIFAIHQGGLAVYGGIIGGLLGGIIMAKARKLPIMPALDLSALGFLIGQSVGRWGNFVNQEAFGSPTTLPWGMLSQNTRLQSLEPVHPCFLYESLWCLLGFILLDLFSRRRKYEGQIFLMYIVWYGAGRFFIEGLRTDSLLVPGLGVKVSQLIAILSVLTGLILLLVLRFKGKKIEDSSAQPKEISEVQENHSEVQNDSENN